MTTPLARVRDRGGREIRHAIHRARRESARRRLSALPHGARLHLGCGTNRFPGWIELDIERKAHPDVIHDLRLGLPVVAGSISLIYSEHVFEHLDLPDAERLMADCRRGLRPDGVMRIAMPDLSALVDRYRGDWQGQAWLQTGDYAVASAAQMLNVALREWGHRYVYDFDDLAARLRTAEFTSVERVEWGRSSRPEMMRLETREDSLLVVEATVR